MLLLRNRADLYLHVAYASMNSCMIEKVNVVCNTY